jgi:hypothetical protein
MSPQSGRTNKAWGVSPRNPAPKSKEPVKRANRPVSNGMDVSPAPRARNKLQRRVPGLTPQALFVRPLRGLVTNFNVGFLGLTPQALFVRPLRGLVTNFNVGFLGLTPQALSVRPLRGLRFLHGIAR